MVRGEVPTIKSAANGENEKPDIIRNQTGKRLKCLHSDNKAEYGRKKLDKHLRGKARQWRLTVPNNPYKPGGGKEEWENFARCLRLESGEPYTDSGQKPLTRQTVSIPVQQLFWSYPLGDTDKKEV